MPRPAFDPHTDYYGLLGVPSSAPAEQIRGAYRQLAKRYHPDLHAGSPTAVARMARLNRAKAILLEPATRAAYDEARQQRGSAAATMAARPRPAPPVVRGRVGVAAVAQAGPPRPVTPRPPLSRHTDRASWLMLLVALPFVGAVLWYVAGAVEIAGRPVRAASSDLALSPVSPRNYRNVALAALSMVSGKPANRRDAVAAYNVIDRLNDFSPEGQVLRVLGLQLIEAGTARDEAAWQEALGRLCALADHCQATPAGGLLLPAPGAPAAPRDSGPRP